MESQKRLHTRITCHSHCLLMGHDDNFYEGLMEDISLGGALVKVSGDTDLHVGDSCDLMMGSSTSGFPLKRTFEIVRFDSENMGISFLT